MRPSPADLALRGLRVLLAAWLVVGPFLLGFGGTFAQRQDSVLGLILLPLMALGLLVPGMRIAMLIAGAWLVMSPSWSYGYDLTPLALWHDRIVGLACLFLGFLPLPTEARVAEPTPSTAPAHTYGQVDRPGWNVFRRRRDAAS